jgi:hypothetical protein
MKKIKANSATEWQIIKGKEPLHAIIFMDYLYMLNNTAIAW